jgi:hypothetical protein
VLCLKERIHARRGFPTVLEILLCFDDAIHLNLPKMANPRESQLLKGFGFFLDDCNENASLGEP